MQVSLKSDKNNGYFTWKAMYIFGHSLLLLRMRNVADKSCREDKKNTLSALMKIKY